MPAQRSSILRGPAIVTFDSQKFYTKGDIKVNINLDTFEVDSSAYGKLDERTTQRKAEVSFTPVGEWEATTTLFPYRTMNIGTSIFTGTDKPLVIHTLDGKTLTFKAAAVTKCPDIIFSATKTRFGEVTFTCIGSDNTAWTVTDSLLAIASSAFSDTTLDPANIKTEPIFGQWGTTSPWGGALAGDGFHTAEGFVISHDLSFQNLDIDSEGMIDMMLAKISLRAKAKPIGATITGAFVAVTETDVITALKIQGAGNLRGKSLAGSDLVIKLAADNSVLFRLKGAALHDGDYEFGHAALRLGELEWVATRTLSAGVVQPLFDFV
jgi:hypothetical protein